MEGPAARYQLRELQAERNSLVEDLVHPYAVCHSACGFSLFFAQSWELDVETSERTGTMDNLPQKLYHGTGILQLAEILHDGFMEVGASDDYDDSGICGVSLTRLHEVARKFAEEAKERDWRGEWNSPVFDGVVLRFDTVALANTVSLKSVTWDGTDSEAEVRTVGRIYDPLRFIDNISISPASLDWWIRRLSEEGDNHLVEALMRVPSSMMCPFTTLEESAEPPANSL